MGSSESGELKGYSNKSHFTPILFLAKCGAQLAGREGAEFPVLLLGQHPRRFFLGAGRRLLGLERGAEVGGVGRFLPRMEDWGLSAR